MAEHSSGGASTQIVVALIGGAAVVAAAIFGNWDKVTSGKSEPAPAKIQEALIPNESAPVANIAGRWHDQGGFTYVIEQRGEEFSYGQFKGGIPVGTGQGRIDGQRMDYGFTGQLGDGRCQAIVASGGLSITGTCGIGGQVWPFQVTR